MIQLFTPISESQVRSLKLGDQVSLSGRIFTARDRAHAKLIRELPEFLRNGVIYHCGPIAQASGSGWKLISAGPTTSSRMNPYTPELIRNLGIKAIIGKGGMDAKVAEAMQQHGCVYLAFPGGAGLLAANSISRVVKLHYPELGMAEGVWELEVKDFGPLIVAMDSHGNSIYHRVESELKLRAGKLIRELESMG